MKRYKKQQTFKEFKQILETTNFELHNNPNNEVHYLNLEKFKIFQCKITKEHNHKNCPNFHNEKDRKRQGNHFSSEMCVHIQKNKQCLKGEDCEFSHNYVEMLYREAKYKTKFCEKYPYKIDECEYGIYCSFAHSVTELSVPLIHTLKKDQDFYMFHFKTVFCPFNQFEHDRSQCEYCHNWQDFRRKPNFGKQELKECPNWKGDKFLMNYEDGCRNGFGCPEMHGWKEIEYHPRFYKTQKCQEYYQRGFCSKKAACPLYHDHNEKREISLLQKNEVFYVNETNRNFTKKSRFQLNIKNGLINCYKTTFEKNKGILKKQIENSLNESQIKDMKEQTIQPMKMNNQINEKQKQQQYLMNQMWQNFQKMSIYSTEADEECSRNSNNGSMDGSSARIKCGGGLDSNMNQMNGSMNQMNGSMNQMNMNVNVNNQLVREHNVLQDYEISIEIPHDFMDEGQKTMENNLKEQDYFFEFHLDV